jgi:hypothetical protein
MDLLMEIKVEVPSEPLAEIMVQAMVDEEEPQEEETLVQATAPDEEGQQQEDEHVCEREQPSGTRPYFPPASTPPLQGATGVMMRTRPCYQPRLAPQLGLSSAAVPVSGRASPLVSSQEALADDLVGPSSSMKDFYAIEVPSSETPPRSSLRSRSPSISSSSSPMMQSLDSVSQLTSTSSYSFDPESYFELAGMDFSYLDEEQRRITYHARNCPKMVAFIAAQTKPFRNKADMFRRYQATLPGRAGQEARRKVHELDEEEKQRRWKEAAEKEAAERFAFFDSRIKDYRFGYNWCRRREAEEEKRHICAWEREQCLRLDALQERGMIDISENWQRSSVVRRESKKMQADIDQRVRLAAQELEDCIGR